MWKRTQYRLEIRGRIIASVAVFLIFFAVGCRTRREIVLEETDMANMSFNLADISEQFRLEEGKEASFVLWNETTHQSQHVLQLAPDVAMEKRFHRRHDMTLFGIAGRAIVPVEGKRHVLEPGDAIFIPRMHGYEIIPHESPGDVIAVMVFSPPFDGRETLLLNK